MLKFFSKVFINPDKESLEKLARELTQNSITKANQLRRKNVKILENSSTLTLMETTKFISQHIEYKNCNIFMAFSSVISSGLLFTQDFSKEILTKTIIDDIIFSYPTVTCLEKALKYAGVPSNYLACSVVGTFSALQVMGIRVFHGFHSRSIIDFALSSAVISLIHYTTLAEVRALKQYLHIIPATVVALPIAYVSNNLVQRIAVYGIANTWKYFVEGAISWILKIKNKDLPQETPENAEIPQEMMCSICQDILKDPVESLGYFFCQDCFEKWVNENHTHPGTGEPLTNESVTKSGEMNAIVMQYRKIIGI